MECRSLARDVGLMPVRCLAVRDAAGVSLGLSRPREVNGERECSVSARVLGKRSILNEDTAH